LADSSDTILLGLGMTREFIDYWENVVDNQPYSQVKLDSVTSFKRGKILSKYLSA